MRLALLLVALLPFACRSAGPVAPEGSPPTAVKGVATILSINDVYRIEGLNEGAIGGLARVRALRAKLEREHPDLLMLHGGDFLFPSFASRRYGGAQMIDAMNSLDGDRTRFDSRMFVTFGNHEFDRPRMRDVSVLQSRVKDSQFHWLAANITFRADAEARPLIAGPNVSKSRIVTSGGLRIGLFGLTIPTPGVEYVADFAGELATARTLTAELRAQGVDVVVALTHQNASTDRAILRELGAAGPDVIIGGHDHEKTAEGIGGRLLLRADADARTAAVATLTVHADGRVQVAHRFEIVDGTVAPDPQVQELVDAWQQRHAREFCAAVGASEGCLDEVYGRTRTELVAEETHIRSAETSLGNWVADKMLGAFRSCGAQVAFINSGSLRINRDLAPGPVTRRAIEEIFQYETPLHLLRLDGATLMNVADQSVRGWPGSGSWLQVAGFGFHHDMEARRARALSWLSTPVRPIRPEESVLAVTGDFLVNPGIGDQDGYTMLGAAQFVKDCPVIVRDLKDLIIDELRKAEPQGIAPAFEGRICQGAPNTPCLVPSTQASPQR
jgi:2',3'-cyclic-nucleotide 2'-phosphodiesterase (5'-nucleotidase family)